MTLAPASPLFLQFVDDELLRAPLLFDQLVEAVGGAVKHGMVKMPSAQKTAVADLLHALQVQRLRMGEYFLHSLREQINADTRKQAPAAKPGVDKKLSLSLVEEDEVAVDVELSHTIEAIKSVAEYELRELQTYVSAMVGDLEMARDHNPFRPETWARAVWNSAQAMPLSRGHQVAFMRHAAAPLAQLLRTSYAASTSRLESMGVEPATYRTLILPSGSRRGGRSAQTTYSPDLYRMRETMPAPLDGPTGQASHTPARRGAAAEHWSDVARGITQREDRQAIELVSRLFDAMLTDSRLPPDICTLIARLHGPAMRLALRDRALLDQNKHPMWRFINQLAFSAQMSPDAGDPDRILMLKLAQATIEQLASEPLQNTGLYRWALERLDGFLDKRFSRRLASVTTQIGSLQKLEDKVSAQQGPPSTMSGPLDFHQLDTVPAEFMDTVPPAPAPGEGTGDWLGSVQAGAWMRMFFKGRWMQAQLLWLGSRREFFLFGDGASDETWAVRSSALTLLHEHGLVKTLKQRSIVGSAAAKVHEQLGGAKPA
jgi:hypothetical protein